MKKTRLKWGEWKNMSPEKQKEWKAFLQRRWRHAHPEFVKNQNTYYSKLYSVSKPFTPNCKKCGKKFNAPRTSSKLCPNCRAALYKQWAEKRQAQRARRVAHDQIIQHIIDLWENGMSQTEIAKKYNRTQSGVSALLRRHGCKRKDLTTKK